MHDLLIFISDWWLVAVVGLFVCFGVGAVVVDTANGLRKWLWGEPPKPRRYRVTVEDHDGWPLRTYRLPSDAVGRLMREIERDRTD